MEFLSQLQQDILRYLWQATQAAENPEADTTWGVRWQPRQWLGDDAPQRSSLSRCIRRLEARGLVVRQAQDRIPQRDSGEDSFVALRYRGYLPVFTAGRTTHLQLTARGRAVAAQLAQAWSLVPSEQCGTT